MRPAQRAIWRHPVASHPSGPRHLRAKHRLRMPFLRERSSALHQAMHCTPLQQQVMTGQAELSVSYINASVFSGRVSRSTSGHPPIRNRDRRERHALRIAPATGGVPPCAAAPLCVCVPLSGDLAPVGGRDQRDKVFNGIDFERQEDRVRHVEWIVAGASCTILLTAGEQQFTLSGEHVGDGVVRFSAEGMPFEYRFHQVGTDTLLVCRTEAGKDGPSRLDCGSIVLTSEDTCVQTIVHLEEGALQMLEVIMGTRSCGEPEAA